MGKHLIMGWLATTILTFFLVSCDTRDDYFYEHCQKPEAVLEGSDINWVEVNMRPGERKSLKFSFNEPYEKGYKYGLSCIETYGHSEEKEYYLKGGKNEIDTTMLSIKLVGDSVVIQENTSLKEFSDWRKEAYEKWATDAGHYIIARFVVNVEIENIIGVRTSFRVTVNIFNNTEPIMHGYVKRIEGSDDVEIVAEPTDADNDDIVLYEYCVGQNAPLSSGYGYEYWEDQGLVKYVRAGTAASGIYYPAMRTNSIRYTLQGISEERYFYARAKDSKGLWSSWEQLEIKE